MKKIPEGCVPLTPKMKEKIRNAQRNLGLTDKNVAITLGTDLDVRESSKKDPKHRILRYKNYKRADSSISYIHQDLLAAIANCLHVSTRFLLDETQDTYDGIVPITIVPPLHRRLLIEELNNDDNSTEALYFLYCELPSDIRKKYISPFIAFIDFFRETSIYSSTAYTERTEAMTKLIQNDHFFGDSYIKLMQAGDFLKDENRMRALQVYLHLVLIHGDRKTAEDRTIMTKVLTRLTFLRAHWKEFPTEISRILPTLKSADFNLTDYPDIKATVEKIFSYK